ncbi:MAG: hypothetical protein FJ137_22750, partial [Deltaproteobacteria bacterium]|nr:hypothetical protein [Deltaproteobacteria bacterium]
NEPLGTDPATKKPVYVKSGRFGPYVQLGDVTMNDKGKPTGDKPRMASLWPSMTVPTLTLDEALLVLSFPKVIGKHPETGLDVTLFDGKFGPYVAMEGTGKDGAAVKETRSLPERAALLTLTLAAAVDLLKQPRARGGVRQVASQAALASLGTSAVTGKPIEVKTGRFGAYVTDGQVNATIPSGRDPARLTLDDALELIATREQRMREQGVDPRPPPRVPGAAAGAAPSGAAKATKKASSATKKAATKKAATKKAAAKAEPDTFAPATKASAAKATKKAPKTR